MQEQAVKTAYTSNDLGEIILAHIRAADPTALLRWQAPFGMRNLSRSKTHYGGISLRVRGQKSGEATVNITLWPNDTFTVEVLKHGGKRATIPFAKVEDICGVVLMKTLDDLIEGD